MSGRHAIRKIARHGGGVLVKSRSMAGTVANCEYPVYIAVLTERQDAFRLRSSFVIVSRKRV